MNCASPGFFPEQCGGPGCVAPGKWGPGPSDPTGRSADPASSHSSASLAVAARIQASRLPPVRFLPPNGTRQPPPEHKQPGKGAHRHRSSPLAEPFPLFHRVGQQSPPTTLFSIFLDAEVLSCIPSSPDGPISDFRIRVAWQLSLHTMKPLNSSRKPGAEHGWQQRVRGIRRQLAVRPVSWRRRSLAHEGRDQSSQAMLRW